MNVLLTAVIVAVAFSNVNSMTNYLTTPSQLQPCQQTARITKYNTFVHRHILQSPFNRHSLKDWTRYLTNSNLCGRVRVQSFIDDTVGQVQQICSPAGRRVQGATGSTGNLCISNLGMTVYDVVSTNRRGCKVNSVNPQQHRVVVACDRIGNRCLPVHYQGFTGQMPDNLPCV